MKRAIAAILLLAGCGAARKLGHALKPYWPNEDCFRRFMCEELKGADGKPVGFCGPNASPIIVGDSICYSEDVTKGAKARWICPDPELPHCKDKRDEPEKAAKR